MTLQASLQIKRGALDAGERTLRRAAEVAAKVRVDENPTVLLDLLGGRRRLAQIRSRRGELAEASTLLRANVDSLRVIVSRSPDWYVAGAELVDSLTSLARNAQRSGADSGALAFADQAVAEARRLGTGDGDATIRELLIHALLARGTAYTDRFAFERAEKDLAEAVALAAAARAGGARVDALASVLRRWGSVAWARRDLQAAIDRYSEAIIAAREQCEEAGGLLQGRIELAASLAECAAVLELAGALPEAAGLLREALAVPGPGIELALSRAIARSSLATIEARQGHYDGALERARAARDSLAILIASAPAHAELRHAHVNSLAVGANILAASGALEVAHEEYRGVRDAAASLVVAFPQSADAEVQRCVAWSKLGSVQALLGRPEAGASHYRALTLFHRLIERAPGVGFQLEPIPRGGAAAVGELFLRGEREPSAPWELRLLAQHLYQARRWPEAVEVFARLIADHEPHPMDLLLGARCAALASQEPGGADETSRVLDWLGRCAALVAEERGAGRPLDNLEAALERARGEDPAFAPWRASGALDEALGGGEAP